MNTKTGCQLQVGSMKSAFDISECRKAKYAENPEPYKLSSRKSYRKNIEKVRAYREANKEKRNAQSKAWRKKNKKHILKYQKEWRENNIVQIKNYSREHYSENTDILKAKSARWRKENPELFKIQGKRYRENNKDKIHTKNAKRRALLKGAKVENIDRGKIYIREKGICGICGLFVPLDEMTLDHIIPLIKGGEHSIKNVQIAHLICNSAKGDKILIKEVC